MARTYAGIDIGRSGVKIMLRHNSRSEQLDVIPPYAMPAIKMHDRDQAKLAERDTVTIAGEPWFFGETAQAEQERADPGNFATWSETPDYESLIAGSMLRIRQQGIDTANMTVIGGLPAEASGERREKVASLMQHYAGEGSTVKIIPQPSGPYFLAQYLHPEMKIDQHVTAIIDVGRYSTDFALLNKGRPVSSMFRSTAGVRHAVDHFSELMRSKLPNLPDYERVEQTIRTGKMTVNAKTIDCTSEVVQARNHLSKSILSAFKGYLARCQGGVDYVILAGGGAAFAAADLSTEVEYLRTPNDRYAVANGFMLAAYSI